MSPETLNVGNTFKMSTHGSDIGTEPRTSGLPPFEYEQLVQLYSRFHQMSPEAAARALAASGSPSPAIPGSQQAEVPPPPPPASAQQERIVQQETDLLRGMRYSEARDVKPQMSPSPSFHGTSSEHYRGRMPLDTQLKASGSVFKLKGRDNWHVWKNQVESLIQTCLNAEEIMRDEIRVGHPAYSLDLDIALGSLIRSDTSSCEPWTTSSNPFVKDELQRMDDKSKALGRAMAASGNQTGRSSGWKDSKDKKGGKRFGKKHHGNKEQSKCFRCYSPDHRIADCPQPAADRN
ncbi:hypothetical protein V8E36_000552 [Tilletia maclaganii]